MTDTGAVWVSKGECWRGVADDNAPTLLTDTTLTSITPAPGTGKRQLIDDLVVSVDAACYLSLKEETSGTLVHARIYFPSAGTYPCVLRNGIMARTTGKKIQAQLSISANCSIWASGHPVPGTFS